MTKTKFSVNDFVQWFNYNTKNEIVSTGSGIVLEISNLDLSSTAGFEGFVSGMEVYTVLADGEIRKFYAKDLLE